MGILFLFQNSLVWPLSLHYSVYFIHTFKLRDYGYKTLTAVLNNGGDENMYVILQTENIKM